MTGKPWKTWISMYGMMTKRFPYLAQWNYSKERKQERKMNYNRNELSNEISKGVGETAHDIQNNSYDEEKLRSEIAEQIHNIKSFMNTFDKEIDKYKNGNVNNKHDAVVSMKYAVAIVDNIIADMEPAVMTERQLAEIHEIEAKIKEADKFADSEFLLLKEV